MRDMLAARRDGSDNHCAGGWSGRRTARPVLPRSLAEPATARPVQRALFGIAEQTGDLLQMQSRHREVARRMRSALTVDDVVTAHALGGKLSLQGPRMQ